MSIVDDVPAVVDRLPERVRSGCARYPWVVAAAIVLTGTALRLRQWAYGRSQWLDELALTHNVRDRGYRGLLHPLALSQSAPPGWLMLEHACLRLFGAGDRSLRLVPLVFSVALLVLLWYLTSALLPGPAGWAVLTLVALNPYLVTYANQAKQYSSEAFWVTLIVGYGALLTRRRVGWWAPLGFWALALVGSAFSTTVIPVAGAVGAVLVLGALRDPWPFGVHRLAEIARLLAGAPVWLAAVLVQYERLLRPARKDPALQGYWNFVYRHQSLGDLSATGHWLVATYRGLMSAPLGVPPVIFPVALFLAVLLCWRRCGVGVPLLLLAPAAIGLGGLLVGAYPMHERLALFAVPACFLLLGYLLAAPARTGAAPADRSWIARFGPSGRRRWLRPVVGAGLLLAMLVAPVRAAVPAAVRPATAYPQLDAGNIVEYRQALRYVADHHRPGDLLLGTVLSWYAVDWYGPLDGLRPAAYISLAHRDARCAPDRLTTLLRPGRRAFLVEFTHWDWDDRNNATLNRLLARYGPVHARLFRGIRVVEVELTGAPAADRTGDCANVRPA